MLVHKNWGIFKKTNILVLPLVSSFQYILSNINIILPNLDTHYLKGWSRISIERSKKMSRVNIIWKI